MVKALFIPAQRKLKANKSKILEVSKQLPNDIAIAYSIQFKSLANEIKKILSKEHNIIGVIQVLGCSRPLGLSQPKFNKKIQAILLVGSGKFHAINLALQTDLPIYILEKDKLYKISEKDMQNIKQKQKAGYMKFLNAEKHGILVSTKPGQENLKQALSIKKELKKKSYLFLANNIDTNEFENFGLDSWINTACSRMDMNDSRIINYKKIS